MDKAIRFMAPVNAETSDLLFKVIDELVNQGMTRLHLLLSTPGGSVFHGLSIHNYLRGLPIPVFTYNFGSVDSIGVVIYCAGMQRFTVPHSRFLIHSVKFNINGKVSMDEKQIEEYLKGVKIDQRNIARVMSDTTGRPVESIEREMIDRTTLNPEEAVAYGLVHAVKKELIPAGTEMMAIGEPIPNQPYQARKVKFQ